MGLCGWFLCPLLFLLQKCNSHFYLHEVFISTVPLYILLYLCTGNSPYCGGEGDVEQLELGNI